MTQCCKVITTCFIGRAVRSETTPIGCPAGWFQHPQNFPDEETVLHLVERNIELERSIDPGIAVDTIIVNNDVSWEKGNSYLLGLHNTPMRSGKLLVLQRENFGRSFGGYNAAFQAFKENYKYWLFTEDDILVNGDKYFKKLLDQFQKETNTGFVAVQGLSLTGVDHKSDRLHAHGGVGLSERSILENVCRSSGYLPHATSEESQSYFSIITRGEIPFTNSIAQLGFKLVDAPKGLPLYTYADDFLRGSTTSARYLRGESFEEALNSSWLFGYFELWRIKALRVLRWLLRR